MTISHRPAPGGSTSATGLPPSPAAAPAASPRVLIADEAVRAELLAASLARAGVRSDRVGDGALAVDAVCAAHYDGVLLAPVLPVLDGEATAALLRAIGFSGPIIALLGDANGGAGAAPARLYQAGYSGMATVPLGAAALHTILDDLAAAATPGALSASAARSAPVASFKGGVAGPPALPPSDTGFEDLPAFAGFRSSFRAALGARLLDLARAAAGADWDTVARQAHNLKGSGGTFGFPEVTAHANDIELAARRADAAAVDAALMRLRTHADVLSGAGSSAGKGAGAAPAL